MVREYAPSAPSTQTLGSLVQSLFRRPSQGIARLAIAGAIVAASATVTAAPASASANITLGNSTASFAASGTATATVTSLLSGFHIIFPSTFTSTVSWPSSQGTCPAGLTVTINTVTQTSPGLVKCVQWIGGGELWWSVYLTGGANYAVNDAISVSWTSALLQNPSAAGSYTVNVTDGGTSSLNLIPISVSISAGSSSSGGSSAGSAPAPILQQYGISDSGTCGGAHVAHLNWAGVADGGWGRSWAAWANEGRGGSVCTRTLNYDGGSARWHH